MEIYVNQHSTIFFVNEEGFRKPNIDEVEFYDQHPSSKIIFDGVVTDQKLRKCKCEKDEIIIEKTKNDIFKITTAHAADHKLYKTIIQLAVQGNYALEINKCEKVSDLFYLDKMVEAYMKTFFK